MSARSEEITEFMTTTMQENHIDNTFENQLAFLKGLQQAWKEDSDVGLEKTLYVIALNGMVMILEMKLRLIKS